MMKSWIALSWFLKLFGELLFVVVVGVLNDKMVNKVENQSKCRIGHIVWLWSQDWR